MVFKGRIFGGARNFHQDPYLNNTTIPFDHVMTINWTMAFVELVHSHYSTSDVCTIIV